MTDRCAVCKRDPARANGELAECSHIDCPHRRKAWSERPTPQPRRRWPEQPRKERPTPPLSGTLPSAPEEQPE